MDSAALAGGSSSQNDNFYTVYCGRGSCPERNVPGLFFGWGEMPTEARRKAGNFFLLPA
jgi:hypothetical protein